MAQQVSPVNPSVLWMGVASWSSSWEGTLGPRSQACKGLNPGSTAGSQAQQTVA